MGSTVLTTFSLATSLLTIFSNAIPVQPVNSVPYSSTDPCAIFPQGQFGVEVEGADNAVLNNAFLVTNTSADPNTIPVSADPSGGGYMVGFQCTNGVLTANDQPVTVDPNTAEMVVNQPTASPVLGYHHTDPANPNLGALNGIWLGAEGVSTWAFLFVNATTPYYHMRLMVPNAPPLAAGEFEGFISINVNF